MIRHTTKKRSSIFFEERRLVYDYHFRQQNVKLRLLNQRTDFEALNQLNGDRTRSFFALADLVFDKLAFAELFDRCALHFGMMEKQVVPFSFDETEPFF